jgi:lipopolysaccharide heptosyltransferase I
VLQLPSSVLRALGDEGRGLTVLALRLSAMGDILRTLPPVRVLRRAAPRLRIYWVVEDRWAGVLSAHPDLDGVISVPRKGWQELLRTPAGWLRMPGSVNALRRDLRSRRADLVLDFHGNLRSGLIAGFSGSPIRVGYEGHHQKEGNRWFTTHRVPAGDRRTPRLQRNLDLVRALGIDVVDLPDGGLPVTSAGCSAAEAILNEFGMRAQGYAVISPGASARQAYKVPPAGLLAAAARRQNERGLRSIVVWGPGEEVLARKVVEHAAGSAVVAPATDLDTLRELLRRARLFVGGDTGPLHMACAVGCPVIGIYGPTDPIVNGPWGVPHRTLSPPGRRYTGIKRVDRRSGFGDLSEVAVGEAVDSILNELG